MKKLTIIGITLSLLLGLALWQQQHLVAAKAAPLVANIIVDDLGDNTTSGDANCTLREAITNANNNSDTTLGDCAAGTAGLDIITFSFSGTITLGSSLPTINDDVTIEGTGQSITVSGNISGSALIVNSGKTLSLIALTIDNNCSICDGAGIYNDQGTLNVTDCTFSGNSASGNGGAIFSHFGTVNVTQSTFSGNTAGSGGAILNGDDGILNVTNSTFSGNSAPGGPGGAIANRDSAATTTLTNSTFSGNSAAAFGGALSNLDATLTLRNTIVANNSPGNCGGDPVIDGGGNLQFGGSTANSCGASIPTGDPNLGPLDNNGGPTFTHALCTAAGVPDASCSGASPAIDAGVNALALDPGNQPLTTDQRGTGFPRFSGCDDTPVVDIGAFEVQQTCPVNQAPVNSVPGPQTTNQNTPLVFSSGNGNLISISDPDAGSNPVKVTLTATNGTLTLSGVSGLTFSVGDGTADATMTFTGTIININAALNGLTFTPTANFTGPASLQIVTDDQGNTGSGGPLTDTDTVAITVGAAANPADLDIEKSDVSDHVLLGGKITYKIEVENKGPGSATNVVVTDTLPASVIFQSASPGCVNNSGTVTCTISSLAKHREAKWIIVVKSTVAGKVTNTATVTANEPDPRSSNNRDNSETKVEVGLSLSPNPVKGGKNVTGTLRLGGPVPNNTVVNLSSRNNSVAKPNVTSVTIPANQTSATFTIKTSKVSKEKKVTIKATANGTSKEVTLTVKRDR